MWNNLCTHAANIRRLSMCDGFTHIGNSLCTSGEGRHPHTHTKHSMRTNAHSQTVMHTPQEHKSAHTHSFKLNTALETLHKHSLLCGSCTSSRHSAAQRRQRLSALLTTKLNAYEMSLCFPVVCFDDHVNLQHDYLKTKTTNQVGFVLKSDSI